MDRRDFLKAAAAAPLAAYLPGVEAAPGLNAADVRRAITAPGYQLGDWYVVLHPQQERDLRDLQARERWAGAQLAWRKDGKPAMTCRQILDKYTPLTELEFPAGADVGIIEGFRFIESASPV